MKKQIWRWGIIGPGRIATKFVQGLVSVDNARFLGAASRSPERAEAFVRDYPSAQAYSSYEALVSDPDIDVVYIATLNAQHYEPMRLALEHDKHVLCEKPFTLNASEAEKLIALAAERKLFLMEGMWTRTHPVTRKVLEWIEDGRIGELTQLDAQFGFAGDKDPESRVIDLAKGGSALMDTGIYPVSYASMLFSRQPQRVVSLTDQLPTKVDLTNNLIFDYGEGRTARLASSVTIQLRNHATIIGTEGIIEVPQFWHPAKAVLKHFDSDQEVDVFEFPDKINGFEFEVEHVNDCLDQGLLESPLMPLAETLAIMDTMDSLRNDWELIYPDEK